MRPPHRGAQRERALRRVRGGVLAEFAILGFVVWMLLAGILELGRAFTVQQLLQTNARTLARELARLPFDPSLSFTQAIETEAFQDQVLDTRFLVIDSALLARCDRADFGEAGHDADLDDLFATELPFGNRLLRPLMISDRRDGQQMIRYPGTLLLRGMPPGAPCEEGSAFAVRIPELDPVSGAVTWFDVISESDPGRFPLAGGGWAGLQLNYPFQSVGLMAGRGTGTINPATGREFVTFVEDDGASLAPPGDPNEFTISVSESDTGAYAGNAGLGRFYSIPGAGGAPRAVRPFRRILSASAGFRREIFVPAGGRP
ncbi:MAG: TadE family protein [Myxococcota bacterium]